MKRIFISILAVAMAVLPSCEKEMEPAPDKEEQETPGTGDNTDPEPEPEPEPDPTTPVVTFAVTASLDDNTAALFSWAAEDLVTAWNIDADGNYGYAYSERDVTAASVTGSDAVFNFTALPQGGKTWLAYMSNTGYDGCSAMKVEFNHKSRYTQQTAGELPRDMVKLISSEIAIPECSPKADTTVALDARMKLVGTILAYDLTSSTDLYSAEKVLSVELISNDKPIAGVSSSAMAYNLVEGGKYWLDNNGDSFGDECALIWDATSNSVTTTISAPVAVSEQKTVYMPVAPLAIGGYKYVVTTDVALYTFDFSTESMTFAENAVKTVELDLESATDRLDLTALTKDLMYEGGLPETFNVSYEAGQGGISWWFARTKYIGDWVTMEASVPGNEIYYNNVVFTITDDATGQPADWLEVYYRANDTWWDYTVAANESTEPRTATVTATFSDVDGYVIGEAYRTRTLKFTQSGFSSVKSLDFWGSVGAKTINAAAGKTDWGYWVITVNGQNAENWADDEIQKIYGSAEFRCYDYTDGVKGAEVDWLTVAYRTGGDGRISDTWWDITATENTSESPRMALVECVFPAMDGYTYPNGQETYIKAEVVTQKGQDNTVFDPSSAANMWNSMTVEEMFCFYAPDWNKIFATEDSGSLPEGEFFEADGNWYKFKLASATYAQWQAQFAFRTDMASSASKKYDFYCVLNSNQNIGTATVKLVQTGNDGLFYFTEVISLAAGQDYVFKMSDMAGIDMDKISLFFDFGGNPANTEVTVRDIVFQEH